MKRTLNILKVALAIVVLASCANDTKKADKSEKESVQLMPVSSVEWTASKVIGGGHNGLVDIKEDNLVFSSGVLSGGSVVIDMTTIQSTDLEGEFREKLNGHLKSDDFFGVEQFPESVLEIKTVEKNDEDQTLLITADLTIRGITNPLEFVASHKEVGGKIVYEADIVVDRSLYDVKFGSSSFFKDLGDNAINNEFIIKAVIVTDK